MARPDWEEAIKVPLGHIPCGSGNGLCAAALYHSRFATKYIVCKNIWEDRREAEVCMVSKPRGEGHENFEIRVLQMCLIFCA